MIETGGSDEAALRSLVLGRIGGRPYEEAAVTTSWGLRNIAATFTRSGRGLLTDSIRPDDQGPPDPSDVRFSRNRRAVR